MAQKFKNTTSKFVIRTESWSEKIERSKVCRIVVLHLVAPTKYNQLEFGYKFLAMTAALTDIESSFGSSFGSTQRKVYFANEKNPFELFWHEFHYLVFKAVAVFSHLTAGLDAHQMCVNSGLISLKNHSMIHENNQSSRCRQLPSCCLLVGSAPYLISIFDMRNSETIRSLLTNDWSNLVFDWMCKNNPELWTLETDRYFFFFAEKFTLLWISKNRSS